MPGSLAIVSAIVAIAPAAEARQTRVALDIPAGPLNHALMLYAKRTGRQILFTPELVVGKRSRRVSGRLDRDEALRRLLEGTGLAARPLGGGVVMIVRLAAEPNARTTRPHPPPRPILADISEEIVVTALKRPTLLADSPVSLSVETGASLEERGAFDLRTLSRAMPGLVAVDSSTGAQRLTVRGIYGRGEATVGTYYNESPVSGPSGTTFDPGWIAPDVELVDIDRVELLRGPQGTLYGASSMGGTLRVLFNQPKLSEWSGTARAGAGMVEGGSMGWNASAVLNAPIIDGKMALRAVVYDRRVGGYIDRPRFGLDDAGGSRRRGARVALAWQAMPDMRVTANFLTQDARTDDAAFWYESAGRHINDQAVRTPNSNRLALFDTTLHWAMGWATLTATATGYRWRVTKEQDFSRVLEGQRESAESCQRFIGLTSGSECADADWRRYRAYVDERLPGLLYQPMRVTSRNAEVRLQSPGAGAGPVWTAGIFVEARDDRVDSYTVRADPVSGERIVPMDITGLRTIWTGLDQRALFGEISQGVLAGLTATAGIRYFWYKRTARGDVTIPNVLTGTGDLSQIPYVTREEGTNLKFLLAYQPARAFLIYFQAAQGFRPGGVNVTPALAEDERVYHADRLWSYEAGLRFHLPGGVLLGEASVYHIDWSDMLYSAMSANGAFGYNTNIGDVNIDGVEAQLSVTPVPNTELALRANYVDARLAEDQRVPSADGLGYRGDRLPSVPALSWGATARVTPALGREVRGWSRLDVVAVGASGSQFNRTMTNYERTPGRVVVDLESGVQWRDWDVAVSVRNIFGSNVPELILSNSFGKRQIYGLAPRTISVRMGARF